MGLLFAGGFSPVGLYLFYEYVKNLSFAIAFFFADVIFAISAHLVYGEISKTKNRLFLLRERIKIHISRRGQKVLTLAREGQINKEQWKLFWLKLFSSFFYSLISLLAFFKIVGFIANWPGRDSVNSISVTICLT